MGRLPGAETPCSSPGRTTSRGSTGTGGAAAAGRRSRIAADLAAVNSACLELQPRRRSIASRGGP